jgi:hypothetical protein
MTTDRAVSDDAVEAAIRAAEAAHGMGATVTRPMMRAALRAASPFLAGDRAGHGPVFSNPVLFDWLEANAEQYGLHGAFARGTGGIDAEFVMRKLMSALSAPPPQPEVAGLVEALQVFSVVAGELFSRNWNASDTVVALYPRPHRPLDQDIILTAGDFFKLRAALAFMDRRG